MSEKKFGTMFDDDDDMNPVAPSSPASETQKPATPAPVLLNDEARSLLEEKAKAAGEQAKAAAQKSVAAATKAAAFVRERASMLHVSAAGAGGRLPWARIAVGGLVLSVVGGAISWLVLSKDPGNEEPSQLVVPVIPPSVAAPSSPAPVAAPVPERGSAASIEEAPDEPVPDALLMPVMSPASGRYVAAPVDQQPGPVVKADREISPLDRAAQPMTRHAPIVDKPAPKTVAQPPVVKSEQTRSVAPARPKHARPPPAAPVGQREQQQIDQIKSLFGDEG